MMDIKIHRYDISKLFFFISSFCFLNFIGLKQHMAITISFMYIIIATENKTLDQDLNSGFIKQIMTIDKTLIFYILSKIYCPIIIYIIPMFVIISIFTCKINLALVLGGIGISTLNFNLSVLTMGTNDFLKSFLIIPFLIPIMLFLLSGHYYIILGMCMMIIPISIILSALCIKHYH